MKSRQTKSFNEFTQNIKSESKHTSIYRSIISYTARLNLFLLNSGLTDRLTIVKPLTSITIAHMRLLIIELLTTILQIKSLASENEIANYTKLDEMKL